MSGAWAHDPARVAMLRCVALAVRDSRRRVRAAYEEHGWQDALRDVERTCRVAARHAFDREEWRRLAWAAEAHAATTEYDRLRAADRAAREAS